MKYWVYSGGQIYGPHPKEALSSVPGFSAHSLVCPEGVTGDKPGDWSTADSVKDLASALSVGVGSSGSGAKRSMPPGGGLPSSFSGEPDFGILGANLPSSEFSFESLPGALRETPAESALSADVKSYLQELNLKDRRIVSLEEELREAQHVFEKYQGEISRILEDNRRTFEQVHTHLTAKDIALEQASQKINTLEDSLKLVRRPDATLSETLLEMKQEADALRRELEQTKGELVKAKTSAPAPAPADAAPSVVEPPKPEEKAVGGLKLGLKGGLGGLKPIGLSGGPGAKPPLLGKASLGSKPSLGLGLKGIGAKPALEAPKVAEPPVPAPQAQLPAPEAVAPAPAPSAPPVTASTSLSTPAAPIERPSLPPLDLVIAPLQIPMPSWEATAQAPIELSYPGTLPAPQSAKVAGPAEAGPPPSSLQPGGLAFKIPKKDLGVVGAPVDLKPGGAKPLSFQAAPAPSTPVFALKKKSLGPEGPTSAAESPVKPGMPPGAKKLSFSAPAAAPAPQVQAAADAVADIFSAPQPLTVAPAPTAVPVFNLKKKTLGAEGASTPLSASPAPGAVPAAKKLAFAPPPAISPATPKQQEAADAIADIFAAPAPAAPAPAALPAFNLQKKTLGGPSAAPAPSTPAGPTAKPLAFKPFEPAPTLQTPTTAAPAAPNLAPVFNLQKKTLGGPSVAPAGPGQAKKLLFAPAAVPAAPAAPAPQAPTFNFNLTKKTLGSGVGPAPTLAAGPVAKPLSFKPAAPLPLPEVPKPAPIPEPVQFVAPVVEPVVETPPAKSPLEEAFGAIEQAAAAPAPVIEPVVEVPPANSPLEEVFAAAPVVEPPAFKESSVAREVVLPEPPKPEPIPEPVAEIKVPEPPKPVEAPKPEVAKTTVVALQPAKKDEAPAAAEPAKKKSRSTIVMGIIIALFILGGLVTAWVIMKDVNDPGMTSVTTMPDLNTPVPGQNYSLPAPNPSNAAPQAVPGTQAPVTAPGTAPQGTQSQLPTGAPSDRIAEPITDAIKFVKGYPLGEGRGTIANWFDAQFLTTPGEGKEPEWAAVHLEGNKFTVQYRLSYSQKTPQLPEINYVFAVDLQTKTLTGANEPAKVLLSGGKAAPKGPQRRNDQVAGVEQPVSPN